jgi:20S proteasome alpha/beta subunit
MTCIIGGLCEDGIVLAADRKVIHPNGNIESREKIFKDYHPFVLASSGNTSMFDNFRKEALELAQNSLGVYDEQQTFKPIPFDPKNVSGISQSYSNPTSYPIIPQSSYLKGLKEIVRLKKADINKNKDLYPFDVLIASQTSDRKSHLSYIDDNGVLNEIFDPYIIIGSDSAHMYGSVFLKPLVKTGTKTYEFAQIAYFTIKYIDRFRLEDRITLEGEEPLIYIISNRGEIGKAPNNLMEKWKSETDNMLDNFKEQSYEPYFSPSSLQCVFSVLS